MEENNKDSNSDNTEEFLGELSKCIDNFNKIDAFIKKYEKFDISPLFLQIKSLFVNDYVSLDNFKSILEKTIFDKENSYELLPLLSYLNTGKFNKNINLSNSSNENYFNLCDNYLDYATLYVFNKTKPKENMIFIPSLVYQSKSSFFSFKLIFLYLISFEKIERNYKNFNSLLNFLSEALLQEANLFANKLNEEIYENKFSGFEYGEKYKRNLSAEEFSFLKDNLYSLLIYLFKLIDFDFSYSKSEKEFYIYFNQCFKREGSSNISMNKNKIHIFWSFFLFLTELINIIFSRTHYLESDFNLKNDLSILLDDIYNIPSINPKIRPINYKEFYHTVVNFIKKHFGLNFIHIIMHFDFCSEFKSNNTEQYEKLTNSFDTSYFICECPNIIGMGVLAIIFEREFNLTILKNQYKIELFLPLIAVLIKREQNFKFLGIDLFVKLFQQQEMNSVEIRKLNYNIIDIIQDLFEFCGGIEAEIKRSIVIRFLNTEFFTKFDSFSIEVILNELIIEQLDPEKSAPEGGIKDKEISFVISVIKNIIKNSITIPINKNFIIKLINKTTTTEIFFLDIVEILSSGLSFLCSMLILDKKRREFGIYNTDFLRMKTNDLNELYKVVKKWVDKSDDDKLKFIEENYLQKTGLRTETLGKVKNLQKEHEEQTNSFNNMIKKNQAMICLNLIIQADKLLSDYLKELNN